MTDARVVAIVLAGGASRRFGSDKLAASLEGRPVLAHVVERVASVADEVIVVLAPDAPAPDVTHGVRVAHDAEAFGGPLAGLSAGLAAAGSAEVALVVGGDMPWLEPPVLRLLVARVAKPVGPDAAVLDAPHPSPLPIALRAVPAADAVARLLAAGRRSLAALLDTLDAGRVPEAEWRTLDEAGSTLRDVDEPGDLPR